MPIPLIRVLHGVGTPLRADQRLVIIREQFAGHAKGLLADGATEPGLGVEGRATRGAFNSATRGSGGVIRGFAFFLGFVPGLLLLILVVACLHDSELAAQVGELLRVALDHRDIAPSLEVPTSVPAGPTPDNYDQVLRCLVGYAESYRIV